MALTPDQLKGIVMEGTMAYFNQMQKDIEVRLAILLKLAETGLGEKVLINMSHEISKHIVGFMERMVITSGELEKVVNKLL